MEFLKPFFVNLSFFITLSFLAILLQKSLLHKVKYKYNQVLMVILAVAAGWTAMFFGLRINQDILFDLRFIPLIVTILLLKSPAAVGLVGLGIGLARFGFGVNPAATAGFINLTILGIVGMVLNKWFKKSSESFLKKSIWTIMLINVINVLNSGIFGVLPAGHFFLDIVPVSLPISLAISFLFVFIIWDVQRDYQKTKDLEAAYKQLRTQADILEQTKEELEEKARKLDLASRYKTEFLSNMSHELRTPLNSIVILSQLLKENHAGNLDEDEIKYSSIIQSSAEDLLYMINELLDLAKVEEGKMAILKEAVNLTELPEMLHRKFSFMAEQKGIRFSIQKGEGVPNLVYSDPLRLQQIIRNLLSNAFKFTSAGSIRLSFEKAEAGEIPADFLGKSGEWLKIAVTDTGIGIAEDKQQVIFESFRQGDGTISRKYGGAGLGLAVSRELAYLLDGFLQMKSREGEGSIFTLFIPIRQAA